MTIDVECTQNKTWDTHSELAIQRDSHIPDQEDNMKNELLWRSSEMNNHAAKAPKMHCNSGGIQLLAWGCYLLICFYLFSARDWTQDFMPPAVLKELWAPALLSNHMYFGHLCKVIHMKTHHSLKLVGKINPKLTMIERSWKNQQFTWVFKDFGHCMGWQDGSVSNDTVVQTRWPNFDSLKPHIELKNTPESCSLTFI